MDTDVDGEVDVDIEDRYCGCLGWMVQKQLWYRL